MLTEILCALVAIATLAASMAIQPARATCPPGWFVEGVRPTGATRCRRPLAGLENDGAQPPGELPLRVYCTNGTRPIVVDHRTVGCQR